MIVKKLSPPQAEIHAGQSHEFFKKAGITSSAWVGDATTRWKCSDIPLRILGLIGDRKARLFLRLSSGFGLMKGFSPNQYWRKRKLDVLCFLI